MKVSLNSLSKLLHNITHDLLSCREHNYITIAQSLETCCSVDSKFASYLLH